MAPSLASVRRARLGEKCAPQPPGRGAVDAYEPAVKVRLVGVAAGGRHFGEPRPGEDHPPCLGDAPRLLVAMRRQAVGGFEATQKARGRDAYEPGKIVEAQRLAALRLDQFPYFGKRRRSAFRLSLF